MSEFVFECYGEASEEYFKLNPSGFVIKKHVYQYIVFYTIEMYVVSLPLRNEGDIYFYNERDIAVSIGMSRAQLIKMMKRCGVYSFYTYCAIWDEVRDVKSFLNEFIVPRYIMGCIEKK